MAKDFTQLEWDESLDLDCRRLIELAIREDLGDQQDLTTTALVSSGRTGGANLVARQAGVVAGLPVLATAIDTMQARLAVTPMVEDGAMIAADTILASLQGNVRDLLTGERILLNLVGRLMGIATLTHKYVKAVQGRGGLIYDTRKTTPGMRRLEKYAVRCGGARNHRTGLYDAILIKDNHLAQMEIDDLAAPEDAAAIAVTKVQQFFSDRKHPASSIRPMVEIEVDNLQQLEKVLVTGPDIILLDNMSPKMLRKAVSMRNLLAQEVQLEASGGVRLETIGEISDTGVERISVGALTHSAQSLDIGLDWNPLQ